MMSIALHRSLLLAGPAGNLEALLWTVPVEEMKRHELVAVVCHPHPLHGGTLHNKVVFRTAQTLHRLGIPVLRFNFRGTGLSEGVHDEGRGEQEDVRAAIESLASEFSGRRVVLGGFSFGAVVGLRVGCEDVRVTELIGLGLPVDNWRVNFLESCAKPKLLLQGGQDPYGSEANLRAVVEKIPGPTRLEFIAGADHFFAGKLDEMAVRLREWALEMHPELKPMAARE